MIDCFFHIGREDIGECSPVDGDIINQFRPPFYNTIDTYYLEMHSKMDIYFNHYACAEIATFIYVVSGYNTFLENLLDGDIKVSAGHLAHMLESHIIENNCELTPLLRYLLRKTTGNRYYDYMHFACKRGLYYGYVFELDVDHLLTEFNPGNVTSPQHDIESEKEKYIEGSCDDEIGFGCDEFAREVLY